MPATPDLDLTRDALATSTLNHGLKLMGDRWTVAILLGAFLGVRRFDEWHTLLKIPRPTLTERLKMLMQIGLLRQRLYQERPARYAYHLTKKGITLYEHVLMIWDWERRFGDRDFALPAVLTHRSCGHAFTPQLACGACGEPAAITDLAFTLHPNPRLAPEEDAPATRTPRMSVADTPGMGLGLRVDRWTLLIICAVVLGCHYFDQLSHVLGIGPSVLARRLNGMVESSLLQCQVDRNDARRRIYRLTPASRGLFGYIVCFSNWASRQHFHEASSIQPTHKACGQPFQPRVVCSHCIQPLTPWDVNYRETAAQEA
jgi:DNA-binding HxlR family transcriptional regulator